jgi:hypothetical protein
LRQRAVALEEQRAPDSPRLADALQGLADAYHELGRDEDELATEQRIVQLWSETLGPTHPATAVARHKTQLAASHVQLRAHRR